MTEPHQIVQYRGFQIEIISPPPVSCHRPQYEVVARAWFGQHNNLKAVLHVEANTPDGAIRAVKVQVDHYLADRFGSNLYTQS